MEFLLLLVGIFVLGSLACGVVSTLFNIVCEDIAASGGLWAYTKDLFKAD